MADFSGDLSDIRNAVSENPTITTTLDKGISTDRSNGSAHSDATMETAVDNDYDDLLPNGDVHNAEEEYFEVTSVTSDDEKSEKDES